MADQENDDDLFADLYDGEDSGLGPAPSAPASAPAPAVVPEPASTAPVETNNQIATDGFSAPSDQNGADGISGNGYAATTEQGYGQIEMQNTQDWQNQNVGYGQDNSNQNQDDDYDRPIGSKEDG